MNSSQLEKFRAFSFPFEIAMICASKSGEIVHEWIDHSSGLRCASEDSEFEAGGFRQNIQNYFCISGRFLTYYGCPITLRRHTLKPRAYSHTLSHRTRCGTRLTKLPNEKVKNEGSW